MIAFPTSVPCLKRKLASIVVSLLSYEKKEDARSYLNELSAVQTRLKYHLERRKMPWLYEHWLINIVRGMRQAGA
jgi:hypothetical protein